MIRFYAGLPIKYRRIFLCSAILFGTFDFIPAQRSDILCEFSQKTGLIEPVESNSVTILNERTFFDALTESIKGAEDYVLLESFIFSDDSLATGILDLLAQKASEGVRCYLMFDYLGCLTNMGDERRSYLEKGFKPGYIGGYRAKGLSIVFYNDG